MASITLNMISMNTSSEMVVWQCSQVLCVAGCIMQSTKAAQDQFYRDLDKRDAISLLVKCLNTHPSHFELQVSVCR